MLTPQAMGRKELAAVIDQTLLKPDAGHKDAAAWIEGCRDEGFASLCVSPFLVPLASQLLAGTKTPVCSVSGFPLGTSCTETKAEEARRLVGLGAREIDMVANVAAVLEGSDQMFLDDVTAVVDAVGDASGGSGLVKVIIETGFLDPDRIRRASVLVVEAGAAFVKTSTGFGPRGASVEDVRLIREAIGDAAGVKASGGIRDLSAVLSLLEAGATRIGTSAGLSILDESDSGAGSQPGS